MSMRSIFDDERLKMILPQVCVYCGLGNQLSLDHLIPRRAGGIDDPANLVWACRRCNSAKGGRDMLRWLLGDGRFPSIFVLRRYLKCMYAFCEARGLMESHWNCVQPEEIPFAIELFPLVFPSPADLQLWTGQALGQSTVGIRPDSSL